MMAPKSVGATAEIRVSTSINQSGPSIILSVGGTTVYLDAKATAKLLAILCEAELAVFVKVT